VPSRIDPTVWANKWKTNTAGAGQAYVAGVQAVTVSPTELAAQAVDRQVAGVMRAAQSGKTAARLRRVSRESWIQTTTTKGPGRLSDGARIGMPKVQAWAQVAAPVLQQVKEQVRATPKNNLEDGLNRVRMVAEAMQALSQQYK
jgi:hypothetical protein